MCTYCVGLQPNLLRLMWYGDVSSKMQSCLILNRRMYHFNLEILQINKAQPKYSVASSFPILMCASTPFPKFSHVLLPQRAEDAVMSDTQPAYVPFQFGNSADQQGSTQVLGGLYFPHFDASTPIRKISHVLLPQRAESYFWSTGEVELHSYEAAMWELCMVCF